MHTQGDEVHVSETEASGGSKEGVVRWVLIVGLVLAIGLLSIVWITGAAFQGDAEEEATVSGQMEADEDGSETDSIVSEDADSFGSDGETAAEDTPLDTVEN